MTPHANAPLQSFNTLALQSTATCLVRAEQQSTINEALEWARANNISILPLGEGSNVVFAGDVDAMVLQVATRGVEQVSQSADEVVLNVAAGEPWHAFVEWTLNQGYFGLENLALIPGNVGAAPIQNIGAYGVELQQFVHRVHALRVEDASTVVLDNAQCMFGYRDSIFKGALRDAVVITAVELRLPRHPAVNVSYPALSDALAEQQAPTPRQVFDAVVALRRSKLPDPDAEPNAGSFFKNPVLSAQRYQTLRSQCEPPFYEQPDGSVKIPAAWLIDQCGWKGRRHNDQGVHPQHALVLVNYGNPSGEALLRMATEIQNDVETRYGIALEIEPRVYGTGK
ncbi:MAG: UDP-N-acetylmuramate dehydrogenase [Halioglobus sp.]